MKTTKKEHETKKVAKKEPSVTKKIVAAAPSPKTIVRRSSTKTKEAGVKSLHTRVQTAEGWKRDMQRKRLAKKSQAKPKG